MHSGKIDEESEKEIRLRTSKLTKAEKLAFYQDPDYCFVTKADMWPILRLELDSITREGGVYYQLYNKE